jgi:hypothetical protein
MLDTVEQAAGQSESVQALASGSAAQLLISRLRRHRLQPRLIVTCSGLCAGGLPLRASVSEYLNSAAVAAALHDRLRHALAHKVPVTLALTGIGHTASPVEALETFCVELGKALPQQCLAQNLLGASMRSHVMPLQAFLVITSVLGRGPRYVMLDSLQMQHHADARVQAMTEANWIELWHRRRAERTLQAVYAESVRSRCPLLAEEKTASIVPAIAMPAPAGSAWLPVEMFLPDFSDGRGRLQMPAVRRALHACLEVSDSLIPQLFWTSRAQRSDAHANNRLALLLTGIGDLVIERRSDPAAICCLRWVDEIVSEVHGELWNHSMRMALNGETLPSLLQSDPSIAWHSAEHQNDWSSRWHQVLQSEAVRHRNLLVLSPYSVLPGGRNCPVGFTDLLPVLAHADAIGFCSAPALANWNLGEFSNFHRRAWAAITRR